MNKCFNILLIYQPKLKINNNDKTNNKIENF